MPLKELDSALVDEVGEIVEGAGEEMAFEELTHLEHLIDQAEMEVEVAERQAEGCGCHNCRGHAKRTKEGLDQLYWYVHKLEMYYAQLGMGEDEEERWVSDYAWKNYNDRKEAKRTVIKWPDSSAKPGDQYGL